MKKLITVLLAVLCYFSAFAQSGTCGANVTWALNNGTLTISGTGAMSDYTDSQETPWYPNRQSITSIVIANGVTTIGNYAFSKLDDVTNITIPNSITSIGECALFRCSSLDSITIPNSVTTIGNEAFSSCHSLKSVTMSNLVTTFAQYIFANCFSLTSFVIPNSVTTLGKAAFDGCSALTEIILPNSITTIGDQTFSGCSSLLSITFPSSLTSIGDAVFYKCDMLDTITCLATTPPTIEATTFENYNNLCLVPCSALSLYQADTVWSNFNLQCIPETAVENTVNESIVYSQGNTIFVDNNATHIRVITPLGQEVYNGNSHNIMLKEKGIYIVIVNDKSHKIVIK